MYGSLVPKGVLASDGGSTVSLRTVVAPAEGELHPVRRRRPEEEARSHVRLRPHLRHPGYVGLHDHPLVMWVQGGAKPCFPSH